MTDEGAPMTSIRPYLARAAYEWIVENNCTPHLLVQATGDGLEVPMQFVKDGQIVLNIAPSAVVNLSLGDDFISFRGRFSGIAQEVTVPVSSLLGIYARENGRGMMFEPDDDATPPEPPEPEPERPSLKIVK